MSINITRTSVDKKGLEKVQDTVTLPVKMIEHAA